MPNSLSVENLSKHYTRDDVIIKALSEVSFSIPSGSSLALVGSSGSGKTTLLGLIAGLDSPSSGHITLEGVRIDELTEAGRAAYRRKNLGFVFQSFHLIPTLTALENVLIPAEIVGEHRQRKQQALELLEKIGLSARVKHYPTQLSGGEQQRLALARAFINQPKLLLADEPTGNLDEESSSIVQDLLFKLNVENGSTLIIATHDLELAAKCKSRLRLSHGKIIDQ